MAWLILSLAGLTEIAWVVLLKLAISKSSMVIYPVAAGVMLLNLGLMSMAIRTIPISTAYAVWVGIGTLGTTLFGIMFFKEPATPLRIGLLAILILAIFGLKLTSPQSQVIP